MSTTRFTTSAAARAVLALSATLALAAAPVQAQDKPVNLKMSSWVPAQHPLNPSLQAWADDIKKASNGTITATLFPSEQLGKAFDHYDMARDGIADFAYINPGYQPGRFPIMAGASLPFLFSNGKGGSAAIDAWYRQYAAKEMKDVKFCFAFVHDPGTFHCAQEDHAAHRHQGHEDPPRHQHHRPDGHLARRHQRAGLGARIARHAGARRGRCDHLPVGLDRPVRHRQGGELPHGRAALRHALRLGHEPEQVRQHVARAEEGDRRPLHQRVGREGRQRRGPTSRFAGRAKIASQPGHEIYKLTPEQLDAWRKATAPVEAQWAEGVKKVGQDPKAVLDSLKANLAKQQLGLVTSRPRSRTEHAPRRPPPKRTASDSMINAIEWLAAMFVGIVALNIFVGVVLRKFFDTSIPDAYDFGRMLLGILIFWGIAATSYRGGHITVDLVWTAASPRMKRWIDVFATVVLLFVVTVQTATLFDKVRGTYVDHVLTYDMNIPTWPFYAVAWLGDVSAVVLIAIRTYRLIFHPELLHDEKPEMKADE